MSTPLFESQMNLQTFLSQSSQEQFQATLPFFSLTELANTFLLLQTQPILDVQAKLDYLFEYIDSPITLEGLGKHFSAASFISFLDFLDKHPHAHNRLNFILVGLSPSVFSQALPLLQSHHLHILKQEGLLEPLHYQLTQFVHEGEALKQNLQQSAIQFQQKLASMGSQELTIDLLHILTDCIDQMRDQLLDYLERASTALAIVWHTDRTDLIEKLSSINEGVQYQLTHLVGHSAFDHLASTGLYAFLEQTFANIFDSSLKDDDAAIEGMSRLSIWHLRDYWELGLLPSIQSPEELELDPQTYQEKERWDHQQRLMSLVQLQLERLGIGKVENLKKLQLFSKSLLKAYIEQHRHLLT
jgi:hypothetical protein